MPKANRIGVCYLLLGIFAWAEYARAETSHPVVPAYDRFHSQQPSLEGGRILFNELGCVNCHRNKTNLPSKRGPVLSGISKRVKNSWIQSFLQDPSAGKPGTTMPDFELKTDEVEAITHYLASLKGPTAKKAFKFVNIQRGHNLYHKIGCVTCHLTGDDPDASTSDFPRSPYPDLKNKYDIHSLSAFLYEPHATRPHGRMPRFPLEREDGGDLAAYLLDYTNGDSSEYPPLANEKTDIKLSRLGRDLIIQHDCAACHELPRSERLPRIHKTKLRSDFKNPIDHPQYSLSEYQRESIRLFLKDKPSRASTTSFLETLNCLACHDRNGKGGPTDENLAFFSGDPDLGDAGRIPPSLTEVGYKLREDWLKEAVLGHTKVRPYLNTRMPHFGEATRSLAKRLQSEDRSEQRHKLQAGDIKSGQTLLGTIGGLNCITCHKWGDRESLGIQGLDLSMLSERLSKEWFYEFLVDPTSKQANTLMPSFWPEGQASNQDIRHGDTKAQIASIYAFAKSGRGFPHGYPEVGIADFEIVPIDRPVVQRSFLDGIGTDALLVGYPQQFHYAVNGETGRPALMWKGRFFDAYKTWFSRFPEFEEPLGSDVVSWPDAGNREDSIYKGYRNDERGSPTFISQYMGFALYDQLQPFERSDSSILMRRTIRYTKEAQLQDTFLSHPIRVDVEESSSSDPLTRIFLYHW